jgi:hypothetical protein
MNYSIELLRNIRINGTTYKKGTIIKIKEEDKVNHYKDSFEVAFDFGGFFIYHRFVIGEDIKLIEEKSKCLGKNYL